jgi:NitT/TauT family transport system ATP-binding protein
MSEQSSVAGSSGTLERDASVKIRIERVEKIFDAGQGTVRALAGIDLDIRSGEFLSLVGPSGCGKSTLLRMLARLERPSAGRIAVRHDEPKRPLIAVAFQDYSIFPWKTVEANVAFGLRATGVRHAAAFDTAREWLDRLGLGGFEHAYPAQLSGGMKQRVALARAFALDPEILLLDEPFAALDAQLRQMLQEELLAQWQRAGNRTALFVTHSLDEAILLGDRVALMSARPGRLLRVIDVPFERPRAVEIRLDHRFAEIREELWSQLRDEVRRTVTAGVPR